MASRNLTQPFPRCTAYNFLVQKAPGMQQETPSSPRTPLGELTDPLPKTVTPFAAVRVLVTPSLIKSCVRQWSSSPLLLPATKTNLLKTLKLIRSAIHRNYTACSWITLWPPSNQLPSNCNAQFYLFLFFIFYFILFFSFSCTLCTNLW